MANITRIIGSGLGAGLITGGIIGIMIGLIRTDIVNLDEPKDRLEFQINPKIEEPQIAPKQTKPTTLQKITPPPAAPQIETVVAKKPTVDLIVLEGKVPDFDQLDIDFKPINIAVNDADEQPMVRVPPIMPMRAERSGHCVLRFDVGIDGKPFNIEAVYCTESIFRRPSIRAAAKWNYNPKIRNGQPVIRRGLKTNIQFDLRDENGAIIPERGI